MDYSTKKLLNKALSIIEGRLKSETLSNEFRWVLEQDGTIRHPCSIAQTLTNLSKNRYCNVLPYDYNLVTLSLSGLNSEAVPPGKNQYINASNVKHDDQLGFSLEYIATQGPLRNTAADFWVMALQQRVGCVLMLTGLQEDGLVKCAPYFPSTDGEELSYGYPTVSSPSPLLGLAAAAATGGAAPLRPTSATSATAALSPVRITVRQLSSEKTLDGRAIRRVLRVAAELVSQPGTAGRDSPSTSPSSSISASGSGTSSHSGNNSRLPAAGTRSGSCVSSQGQSLPGAGGVGGSSASTSWPPPPLDLVHLQFLHWPDHGVPSNVRMLLGLCDETENSRAGVGPDPGANSKVVVHCSAGIGRTGTFCAVEIMRRRLRALAAAAEAQLLPPGKLEDALLHVLDVAGLVHSLRCRRMGMVQSYDQYVFMYQALYEDIKLLVNS